MAWVLRFFHAYNMLAGSQLEFTVDTHCSVYKAELLVIESTLDFLIQSFIDNSNISLVSDSLASIKSTI